MVKMQKLVLKRMPGYNAMLNKAKGKHGLYMYTRAKNNLITEVQILAGKLRRLKTPLFLEITYYEPHKKRDLDNIASCKKFIFDGLQKAGKIRNDGWGEITGWNETFKIDKRNPRIEIKFIENVEL